MSGLVEEFARGYSFGLDEYQLEACEQVAAGRGVLVAAPTGAGKTVVGEFAVWMALQHGTKCFYTTPIKALSNQKYHDLCALHGEQNVGLLTGDLSIRGESPIVVMTTEVLRNMLYAGSATLVGLEFVVLDEVHYLADKYRGAVWEEVILGLPQAVQIVSLSATVSNAEEFGDWLDEVRDDVATVVSERRPVPLDQHVIVSKEIYPLFVDGKVNNRLVGFYQSESRMLRDDSGRPRGRGGRGRNTAYGSGRYGGGANRRFSERSEERLVPSRAMTVESLRRANLLPAIVFVFSRQGCEGAVRQLLGSRVSLTSPSERQALLEIAERHTLNLSQEDRHAVGWDWFLDALQRGVAPHHAGLLPSFKAIVEEAFTRGLLKVVYATETLALGINMPARTVVIEKLVKYNGETHADLTPGEFTQLTGRAGRRGIDVEGHAVVTWQAGMDPRAVANLASTRTYPLRSSFTPTYNMSVNLLANMGRRRARNLLEQSFAQFQTDRNIVAKARKTNRDRRKIAELWQQSECDLGDFEEFARLREKISTLEAEAARLRKADKRGDIRHDLMSLEAGDIFYISAGKHKGWAVLIEPAPNPKKEPNPMVMTEDRFVTRVGIDDFSGPIRALARMRAPRRFDPRSAIDRKSLAKSFLNKLETLDLSQPRVDNVKRDAELVRQIFELRSELATHPAQNCPDRELHARFAEQAIRLEKENQPESQKMATRSIAQQFDRIVGVLASLGYLDEKDALTDQGRLLQRIYSELDLVITQAIISGVFDELTTPQLAAVLSTLVYESRPGDQLAPPRMPDRPSEAAQAALRNCWREVGIVERDFRVERKPAPNIGFAEVVYQWAEGENLANLLDQTGMPAGDFVRWVRQVIDLAAQIASSTAPLELRESCRDVVKACRRGIIDYQF